MAASNTVPFRTQARTALALGQAMTRDHDMGRPALVCSSSGPEPLQAHCGRGRAASPQGGAFRNSTPGLLTLRPSR